jgi:hypothetical protein
MTSFSLARVLAAQRNHDEAMVRFGESLRVQEHNLGPRAAEVALTLEEYAKLLHRVERNGEACSMQAGAKSLRAELAYTVKALQKTRDAEEQQAGEVLKFFTFGLRRANPEVKSAEAFH